jgi:chromosomal replication initiator protein
MSSHSSRSDGSFLLLPENQFAHAAVHGLLQPEPAVPVVTVWGPAGVGKSHLVRDAARELLRREPECRLEQLTAREFASQLFKAGRAGAIPEFQQAFRTLDCLICEDLHGLEGRTQPQWQLLAVIDELTAAGGRVLLTGRKSPGALAHVSPRLVSRCHGGVCAALSLPGQESRAELIRHFAACRDLRIPDGLVRPLSARLPLSPRELQGIVIQLQTLMQHHGRELDTALVDEVIRHAMADGVTSLPAITRIVARAFETRVQDLRNHRRLQTLVMPRQVAMLLARECGTHSYAEIGRYFGQRSHSTVMYAVRRARETLSHDPALELHVRGLRTALRRHDS